MLFCKKLNNTKTEAGIGENPLPLSQFDKIYNDIIGILILGAVL